MSPINVEVTSRGEVEQHARAEAREKVAALERYINGPVLGARVVLSEEANPRIQNPARAEAEIALEGRVVRARADGPSIQAAVDELAHRLQRQLRRYVDRHLVRKRQLAGATRALSSDRPFSPRPPTFERPVEERKLVRRKSFAFGPMPVEDAADALEDLDHDFFLFHDIDTGADEVLYWRDDGLLALIEPPHAGQAAPARGPIREPSRFSSPIDLGVAIEEMNSVSHRFMFYEDAASGRGNVIYRRYDGHYGLIELA